MEGLMKSPAELYKESLTSWPEPLPATCLAPQDWRELVGLFVAKPIEQETNVGLQLVSSIEEQGLTRDNFKGGGEFLYVFAFNSLMESGDIPRIMKFHKLHGGAVVDIINNDDTINARAIALTNNLNQGNIQ